MRAFHQYLDEEGNVTEEKEVELTADFTGRIAAQTAKQVIHQKLRDAEREITYEEFAGREGDVVTGIVQQHSTKATFLDLGKVEALLPFQEKVPRRAVPAGRAAEGLHHRGPQDGQGPADHRVAHPPGAARRRSSRWRCRRSRRAWSRSRASRASRASLEDRGDAPTSRASTRSARASAPKGSRVRMVVNELRGEKIDVVEWSEDPRRFVGEGAGARVGQGREDRRGHADRARDRPGLPAVARDRQGRAERPPRRAADRLADRHQEREPGAEETRRAPPPPRTGRGRSEPPSRRPPSRSRCRAGLPSGSDRADLPRPKPPSRKPPSRKRPSRKPPSRRAGSQDAPGAAETNRRRRGELAGVTARRPRANLPCLPSAPPEGGAPADRCARPDGRRAAWTRPGERAGRGAYVCRDDDGCREQARAEGALSRALRADPRDGRFG